MDHQILVTLLILVGAVILYSTQFVSRSGTSLLILLAVYAFGLVEANSLFLAFTNTATLLVIFMFIMGGALIKTGAAQAISSVAVKWVKGERNMMLVLMLLSIAISAFLSNMATAVIVATLAVSICQLNSQIRLQKLLLGVMVGCTFGGMLTIIGVSGNVMVRSILEEAGLGSIGFWDFSRIGFPLTVVAVVYMYFVGYKLSPQRDYNMAMHEEKENFTMQTDERKIKIAICIFAAVALCMMFEPVSGVPMHISAFCGTVALILTKTISDKEAFAMINWPATLMFCSLLTLANALTNTGAATYLADVFIGLVGESSSPYFVAGVLFFIIAVLTQFISNGAVVSVFYPIGLSVAMRLNFNPVGILMLINVAASCSIATPLASMLNAYIMSLADYKFTDYLKVGLPLLFLCCMLSILLLPIVWPF